MNVDTPYKTLVNTWLVAKQPMITPSTYSNIVVIAENYLISHSGHCARFALIVDLRI